MLKRLRKVWKDESTQPSQHSSSPPRAVSSGVESPVGSPSVPEVGQLGSDVSREPDSNISLGHSLKRLRPIVDLVDEDTTTSERPLKLLKIETPDSLRNHLPEVIDARDQDDSFLSLSMATLKDQILERAKVENLIAVVPPGRASTNILMQIISWAVMQEQNRTSRPLIRSRSAVVVVDDPAAMSFYGETLEAEIPSVSFRAYSEDIHRPDMDAWADLLANDLILIPSHLLLDSLLRGALAITQFHLLVISDAQSIRNQDSHASLPIVQVMSEFYRITDTISRPRVFALASSSERRAHFDSKMLKLEATLDAKVFGITSEKRAEILALPDRPNEIVILYDTPFQVVETRLLKQLHQLDPSESIFRQHYHASRSANGELGSCASDLVWRRALKEIEAGALPYYEDPDEDDPDLSPEDHIRVRMRDTVKNWPFTMPNLDPSSRGFNVSHKFLRLVQILSPFKSYGEGFRGIIFVQRRIIAIILAELLRTLDDRLGFLRPQVVIGPSDPKRYQDIFHNFATGVFNLLIATKSMEDLEVPKASVVIRYDLFESQVSHAYVRARTRGRESHLIHMVERGNDIHRRVLSRITNLDADMLHWTELLCNSGESSIPPHTLRETINPYHSDSDWEDEEPAPSTYIKDPTTSGRIYLQDATTVIYRYAAALRSIGVIVPDNQKLFEYEDLQKEFGVPRMHLCRLTLPSTPLDKISGIPAPSRAQARRLACFNACQILLASGYLDCRLVPLPSRLRAQYDYEYQRNSRKDELLEPKSSGTRSYARKQPDFWNNATRTTPIALYPTIVYVPTPDEGVGSFAPIAILTWQPLPDLQTFRLFFSGIAVNAQFHKAIALHVDDVRLNDIHNYTLRLCRAITNKALACSLEDATYFFLPLLPDWTPPNTGIQLSDISAHIPWELVSLGAHHWAVAIKRSSADDIEADLDDAIIQDRWIEFTRRYRAVRVRRDLTPLSKPIDSPREANYSNLFEFCKFKRKGLEELANYEQPIIEVAKVPAILNHLNPTSKPPSNSAKAPAKCEIIISSVVVSSDINKYAKDLIPELCAKFTVPAKTLRTSMVLPSVMRRIDDLLLVKELNAKFFDHAVREELLHTAICTPSAGLEYDYERLELLGDAFLKYLSSIYVFVTNPSLNEGALHVARQRLISNKSLLQHSVRIGLPAYIQSKVFSFKAWQPPKFKVQIPPKPVKADEIKDAINQSIPDDKCSEEREQVEYSVGEEFSAFSSTQREDMSSVLMEADFADPQTPGTEPREASEQPLNPTITDNEVSTLPHGFLVGFKETEKGSKAEPQSGDAPSKKKSKHKKKKGHSEDQGIQWLGDKAIADVAEAIIGAAYISGGREAALQVTKALTLPISNVDRWSDFGRKVLAPPPNITAKLRPGSIAAIEKIIGHKFNRPHLLAQAMTHSSIQGYESTSYERLEFIGDAILDFSELVIRHIFDRDQQLSPGALTMLKGAMVSNSALAAVCVWSGLHKHLLFESSHLESSIQAYANELEDQQEREYALAEGEGRSAGQYWLSIEPPKALSDVVESIIGAIYISDNFSPIGAESLFDNILKPFYDKHITLQTLSHHPTKILFELLQAQGCQQFEIVKDKEECVNRCHVTVHDVILATAEDPAPTFAARQASFLALDALEGDADFMTRTCDCRTHITQKKARKKSAFEQALESALKEDDNVDDHSMSRAESMEDLVEERPDLTL